MGKMARSPWPPWTVAVLHWARSFEKGGIVPDQLDTVIAMWNGSSLLFASYKNILYFIVFVQIGVFLKLQRRERISAMATYAKFPCLS